ncbi:MAG: pilus assembly protein PilM, partial [Candidatus Omnitrophica bacterium]|nr:pilus assembly protein PilM [Candidatus Omnitrophota bacterium]
MIGKSKIEAVDFGSSHIRVLEISFRGERPVISYYNELDISTVPPEKRIDTIKTEGKQFFKKIPSKRIIISLPGRGILIRTVTTPKIVSKKLKNILKFEIQQQIPFPIEVVEWSYQIFSEIENNFQVFLCAIKKDLVNEFISYFNPFNLDIEHLETDFFALYNLFRFSPYFNENKCQGVLEIGARSSNLIILHKEKILMRALTTSGDTITSSISEAGQIEFGEAEKMKIEKGLDLPAVSSAMESLQREVQNSLDYWRYTIKGQDINE